MMHRLRKKGLKYIGQFLSIRLYFIWIVFLILSFNSLGQNIFFNGGFEIEERDKNDFATPKNWETGLQTSVKTPDYFYHAKNANLGGSFWTKFLAKNKSNFFIGIAFDERNTEYFQTKLVTTLSPNTTYEISFDVFLDKRCSKMQDSIFFLLSPTDNIDTTFEKLSIPIPENEPLTWFHINHKFSVDKMMNYFAAGCFENRSNYNHERDRIRDVKSLDSFGCTYLYFDNFDLQIASQKKNPTPHEKTITSISEFVFFRTDSDVISKSEYEKINRFVSKIGLDTRKSARISIIGYADDVGSVDSNIKLSQRRAASIQEILLGYGFLNENIDVQAKGEIQISEHEVSDEKRRMNRRVEMKIEFY